MLWHPYSLTLSKKIDRLERKFLCFVAFVLNIEHVPHDYSPVLQSLGLPFLADRRIEVNIHFFVN